MMSRSPIMTVLCLGYLTLDVVGNTVLFSSNPAVKSDAICKLGVMLTVGCQFGFMAMIWLRMFRV
jgi:hypothetical protein